MTTYYFDNNAGNDSWSGTLPVPNGGLTDGPWKDARRLRLQFGGGQNNFLLESHSVWDYSTSNFAAEEMNTIYNPNGNTNGLSSNVAGSPSLLSNYFSSGIDDGNLPTFTKKYQLLSNAQCKGLWVWDSGWNAWGISFVNYSVVSTVNGNGYDLDLTLGSNVMPFAGCTCTLSTTGVLPTPLQGFTITTSSWAAGYTTYTTSINHNLSPGSQITIVGASPGLLNGTFTIFDTPLGTTFRIPMVYNPGARTSGGQIGYYVYPDTSVGVKLYTNYTDALAGNNNYLSLTGGSGIHTITISPTRGIGVRSNQDTILVGSSWGNGYNQGGMVSPLPTGDGNFTSSFGTATFYVYAPPTTDPGAYYTQGIFLFSTSTPTFQFWYHNNLIIEKLKFVNSPICIRNSGDVSLDYMGRVFEVRNCSTYMSASFFNAIISGTPSGYLVNYSIHDNYIENVGYTGIGIYCPSTSYNNIGKINVFKNTISGCNLCVSNGGGIYIQTSCPSLGGVVVYSNTISGARQARGNSYYDGCALYSEFTSRNVLWLRNFIYNCPVAMQDNSGDTIYWVGNIINGCAIGMNIDDAGGPLGSVNARQTNLYNNTFINMVPMNTFPLNWYGSPNSTPPGISNYASYANIVYSWHQGWSGTCTFSGSTVTIASRLLNSTGSPGSGIQMGFTTTGTLPTPLAPGLYYAHKLTSSTFSLHLSYYESLAGINAISFSGGSGTHTGACISISNYYNNLAISSNAYYASSGVFYNFSASAYYNTIVSKVNTTYWGMGYTSLIGGIDTGVLNVDPNVDQNGKPNNNSPAINAGTFVGYYSDATGRPFNNPPTIGAYEYYTAIQDPYTGP